MFFQKDVMAFGDGNRSVMSTIFKEIIVAKVVDLKRDLIESLTEAERLALISLLGKISKPTKIALSPSSYLQQCETPTFFGFLHKYLFGKWVWDGCASVKKVMDGIDQLKAMLRTAVLTVEFPEYFNHCFAEPPRMPEGLKLNNFFMANVAIDKHAWERFCERFCPKRIDSDKVVDLLVKSFSRAKPVTLENCYMVLRLINNNYTPAQYFLDKTLNCRFVIISRDEKLTVTTAEIPEKN